MEFGSPGLALSVLNWFVNRLQFSTFMLKESVGLSLPRSPKVHFPMKDEGSRCKRAFSTCEAGQQPSCNCSFYSHNNLRSLLLFPAALIISSATWCLCNNTL